MLQFSLAALHYPSLSDETELSNVNEELLIKLTFNGLEMVSGGTT